MLFQCSSFFRNFRNTLFTKRMMRTLQAPLHVLPVVPARIPQSRHDLAAVVRDQVTMCASDVGVHVTFRCKWSGVASDNWARECLGCTPPPRHNNDGMCARLRRARIGAALRISRRMRATTSYRARRPTRQKCKARPCSGRYGARRCPSDDSHVPRGTWWHAGRRAANAPRMCSAARAARRAPLRVVVVGTSFGVDVAVHTAAARVGGAIDFVAQTLKHKPSVMNAPLKSCFRFGRDPPLCSRPGSQRGSVQTPTLPVDSDGFRGSFFRAPFARALCTPTPQV